MAAYNKDVSCAQVSDLSAGIKRYQDQGCSLKYQTRGGCAMIECKDSSVYVCETPKDDPGVSRSPHDEMDEAYQDYWQETPD